MLLLKADAHQYLSKLKTFLDKNRTAKTIKQICAELAIPQEFVEKFFDTLYSTDYFKVEKSPSGRFKHARFNQYAKKIYYRNYHCGMEGGRVVFGDHRNFNYKLTSLEKSDDREFEDKARRAGAFYVNSELNQEVFIKIFIQEMNLTFSDSLENSTMDDFAQYPLVKAELDKYTALVQTLEKEVQEEIDLNTKNAQWYDAEYYKAKLGQRRKSEAYSVVVGQERVVGVSYNKYWFDDGPVREYTESFVPKYETRYRSVVDWPEKPIENTEVQVRNKPLIERYRWYLKNLSDNRIANEKRLQEENEKAQELAKLEAQKRELELKIKRLR